MPVELGLRYFFQYNLACCALMMISFSNFFITNSIMPNIAHCKDRTMPSLVLCTLNLFLMISNYMDMYALYNMHCAGRCIIKIRRRGNAGGTLKINWQYTNINNIKKIQILLIEETIFDIVNWCLLQLSEKLAKYL